MGKSRLHYAVLNMGISGTTTLLKMILSFIVRTIFIYYLGSKVLGVNSLLISILTTLSLAELGIGNAIIFSLYKPVAENNWSVIKSIMNLYRKIYRILAVLIFFIGLLILPFLPMIVGNDMIPHIKLYFLILLVNSSVSYLLTYNRSLIMADQKNYIVSLIDFLMYGITAILQIVFLVFLNSYILYLVTQVVFTLFGNVMLTTFVHRYYGSNYVNISLAPIPEPIISKFKKNVVGTFANKLGDVVVNGTDNILISIFINISTVGLYSNYQLIITAVQTLLLSVSGAMTSSIGNFLSLNKTTSKQVDLFYLHQFMNYTLTFFSSAFLLALFTPFITNWVGSNYLLSSGVTVMMVINFVINRQRNSGNVFIDALGLAFEQRLKPLIEAVANLALSVLFLWKFHLGIFGILLATNMTSLLIAMPFETFVVFSKGFKISVKNFYINYARIVLEIGINLLIVNCVMSFFYENQHWNGLLMLVSIFLVTAIVSVFNFYILNFRKNTFKTAKILIINRFNRG